MPEGQALLADRLFAITRRVAPDMPEATAWKLVAALVAATARNEQPERGDDTMTDNDEKSLPASALDDSERRSLHSPPLSDAELAAVKQQGPGAIAGYRGLSPEQVEAINELKRLERQLVNRFHDLAEGGRDFGAIDARPRDLALARTHIQTGMMWAVRAIAKPDDEATP